MCFTKLVIGMIHKTVTSCDLIQLLVCFIPDSFQREIICETRCKGFAALEWGESSECQKREKSTLKGEMLGGKSFYMWVFVYSELSRKGFVK